jgi:hypothetical protein
MNIDIYGPYQNEWCVYIPSELTEKFIALIRKTDEPVSVDIGTMQGDSKIIHDCFRFEADIPKDKIKEWILSICPESQFS